MKFCRLPDDSPTPAHTHIHTYVCIWLHTRTHSCSNKLANHFICAQIHTNVSSLARMKQRNCESLTQHIGTPAHRQKIYADTLALRTWQIDKWSQQGTNIGITCFGVVK